MVGEGFEPPKAEPAELQSDPFGRLGNPPGAFHTKVIPGEARKSQQYNMDTRGSDPLGELVDDKQRALTDHLTACA